MSSAAYLSGLVLATLLALACSTAILVYFEPNQAGPAVFILLYLTIFFGSTGFLTIIGFIIRRFSRGARRPLSNSHLAYHLIASFRQGLLLSVILISTLILQSQRLLAWWNLLGIVIIVGLVEWWAGRR